VAAESLPNHSARALPSSIGRYEILCLLGEGGMARVFLALRRDAFGSEKLVVIKQVRPEFAADTEFLVMFMDESRIALPLNHPNVVHTYEVVGEDPDYFLSMEYLEGRTLAQVLRRFGRRSFPVDLHIWILCQVLAGLQYAHELRDLDGTPLGIVHRDVSPSNVLVTSAGEVKLLDFGIAKAAGAATFTQHGVVKGKLGYAAPEQFLGHPSDARTDLFAVGMMLWEAIAGQRRSQTESKAAALQARISNNERGIERVIPDVSPHLAGVCRRALAHSRDERYGSAAEFRADLEAHLADQRSRLNAANVAEVMSALFLEDFNNLRGQIEAHVQKGRRGSASVRRATQPGKAKPVPHTLSVVQSATSERQPRSPQRKRALIEFPFRSPQRKRALIALGGFAMVGTMVLVSVVGPEESIPRGDIGSMASAAAFRNVTALTAFPSAVPVPPVSSVRIAIGATPTWAQIWLDGQRVPNPFVGTLPRDDREHDLEVRAAGYHVQQQTIRLSQDVALTVELRAESSAGKAPISAARPVARSVRAQPSSGVAGQTLLPSEHAPALNSSSQPAQTLIPPPRVVRAIDESDPY
jgi:serine/threonine protein kinase